MPLHTVQTEINSEKTEKTPLSDKMHFIALAPQPLSSAWIVACLASNLLLFLLLQLLHLLVLSLSAQCTLLLSDKMQLIALAPQPFNCTSFPWIMGWVESIASSCTFAIAIECICLISPFRVKIS